MEWQKLTAELKSKIRSMITDLKDWKVVKETPEVTVWSKPSDVWKGSIYKTEGIIDCDPDTVFYFIDPTIADGPRNRWDKSIKERQVLENIEPGLYVLRTVTHGALAGLISQREFIDMIIIEKNDEFLGTLARTVEYSKSTPSTESVLGTNYPSALVCSRIPGSPNQTRLTTLIQTDLGGMLPQSLVDQAVPSSQFAFFSNLTQALKDAGHWKGK